MHIKLSFYIHLIMYQFPHTISIAVLLLFLIFYLFIYVVYSSLISNYSYIRDEPRNINYASQEKCERSGYKDFSLCCNYSHVSFLFIQAFLAGYIYRINSGKRKIYN